MDIIDLCLFVPILKNCFSGNVLHWNHKIRLRHVTTNKYLSINPGGEVCLNAGGKDPTSVFLLHPVTHPHAKVIIIQYCI